MNSVVQTDQPKEAQPKISNGSTPHAETHQDQLVRAIYEQVAQGLEERTKPGPSLRLQLNSGFTLIDAIKVIPHLKELGVQTVYISPPFKAVPGSKHGYDQIRHTHINPELGGTIPLEGEKSPEWRGEIAFKQFMAELTRHGMDCRIDVVPNHMGVGEGAHENRWWQSVLKFGRKSPCAEHFYIDFDKRDGRVTTPFLGATLNEVIRDKHIRLECDSKTGALFAKLYGHTPYPISPETYRDILVPKGPDGIFNPAPKLAPDELERRLATASTSSLLEKLVQREHEITSRDGWESDPHAIKALEAVDRLRTSLSSNSSAKSPEYLEELARHDPARLFRETIALLDNIADCSFDKRVDDSLNLPRRVFEVERRIGALLKNSSEFQAFLEARFSEFHENPAQFRDLLDKQVFDLCHWKYAVGKLNVSRFFDVNSLWALAEEGPRDRSEHEVFPRVFKAVHQGLFRLVDQYPQISGLRIDHPDGLYAPAQYLYNLQLGVFLRQARTAFLAIDETKREGVEWHDVQRELVQLWRNSKETAQLDVVLEKILGAEELPPELKRAGRRHHAGTVGYEIQSKMRAMFIDPEGLDAEKQHYATKTGESLNFTEEYRKAKEQVVRYLMTDEFSALAGLFKTRFLGSDRPDLSEINPQHIQAALESLAIELPVYRTYMSPLGLSEQDVKHLEHAFTNAERNNRMIPSEVFTAIREVFQRPGDLEALDFVRRFQRCTGPVTAKAVEDRAFYLLYQSNLALLDVGAHPERGAATPQELHELADEYLHNFPRTMIAQSTHDNKRNQAVAGRLVAMTLDYGDCRSVMDVFDSQAAQSGFDSVMAAFDNPAKVKSFLYRTVLSTLPTDFEAWDEQARAHFIGRIVGENYDQGYLAKALREGKEETSWINPDMPKFQAVREFLNRLLTDQTCIDACTQYLPTLSERGARVTLAWKILATGGFPGIPDMYQEDHGELRLVDPDNRGVADFGAQADCLARCKEQWNSGSEARVALIDTVRNRPSAMLSHVFCSWKGFHTWNQNSELFLSGAYRPLTEFVDPRQSDTEQSREAASQRNFAFLRVNDTGCVLTLANTRGESSFSGQFLVLPNEYGDASFRNEYTNRIVHTRRVKVSGETRVAIPLEEAYDGLPGATLSLLEDRAGTA